MSKHFSLNHKKNPRGEWWDVIAKNFGFCKGIIRRSTVSNEYRFYPATGSSLRSDELSELAVICKGIL